MSKSKVFVLAIPALLVISALVIVSCGDDDKAVATGSLDFYANGEEFVRDGFTSMDDWDLTFTHLYVNVRTPTAFQAAEPEEEEARGEVRSRHAGHPHANIPEGAAHVTLTGMVFVDLAQGDDATLIGTVEDAEIGNYNYINFDIVAFDPGDDDQEILPELTPAEENDYAGYSIILIGIADDGRTEIEFTIKLVESMEYSSCGPWDDGIVETYEAGTAEMTFHFDHVFGDAGELPGEGVNEIAMGFDPLADLWSGSGPLEVNQALMGMEMSGTDFLTFIDALRTIGHSGEGHCAYEKIW